MDDGGREARAITDLDAVVRPRETRIAELMQLILNNLNPEIKKQILDIKNEEERKFITTIYAEYIAELIEKKQRRMATTEKKVADTEKDLIEIQETYGEIFLERAKQLYVAEKERQEMRDEAGQLSTTLDSVRVQMESHPLTGLLNGKGASKLYEMARAKEREGSISGHTVVVRFDIDGFKLINHLLGHRRADEILIKVAEAMQKTMRLTDIKIQFNKNELHFSGDEFGLLLVDIKPKTDDQGNEIGTLEDSVEEIIKRVLEEIEKVEYTYTDSNGKQVTEKITASPGYYIVPKDDNNPFESVDKLADEASEKSKDIKTAKTIDENGNQIDLRLGSRRIINFTNIEEIGAKLNISREEAAAAKFEAGIVRAKSDFIGRAFQIGMSKEGIQNVLDLLENASLRIRLSPEKMIDLEKVDDILSTIEDLTESIIKLKGFKQETIDKIVAHFNTIIQLLLLGETNK